MASKITNTSASLEPPTNLENIRKIPPRLLHSDTCTVFDFPSVVPCTMNFNTPSSWGVGTTLLSLIKLHIIQVFQLNKISLSLILMNSLPYQCPLSNPRTYRERRSLVELTPKDEMVPYMRSSLSMNEHIID